jgi:hypothetical protein
VTARAPAFAAALTALALVGGCDDDDNGGASTTSGAVTAAPEAGAAAQAREVQELLARAADQYRAGDRVTAERTVGDAYLEHFEEVEEALEKRDHELMESLEKTISTTIRDRMKAGAPAAEITRLVSRARLDLVRAEALLR